jgi:hypothetical protein
MMGKALWVIGVAALLIILVIAGPLIVIWAWNTLFGAGLLIPYTFWTWLAVLVIGTFIRSDIKVTKKS